MKQLRTCSKGHKYYKSSDCPVCPVCEKEKNQQVDSWHHSLHRQEEHWRITG